ncbi:MAG: FAD-dependent oxidoreductase [Pseudomonadota bacterium]
MFQDRYHIAFKLYPYARSSDQDAASPVRHSVVIVGGGPMGFAMALELGLRNIPVLLLDDHEGVGGGSRAICFAKRTLAIADRYGCAEGMVDKGVIWNLGKVFHKDSKVFEFNLLPEEGHKFPAFINLQQPYFERFLVERVRQAQADGAPIQVRGKNRVGAFDEQDDHVALTVDTPEGEYRIDADWVIACDGAGSPMRTKLGLDFIGRVFEDSFLIVDIRMRNDDFPTERWFWFEPSHGNAASALLHKQPDGIWRVDFQVGWHADREEELKEVNVRKRLDAFFGPDVEYDIVWTSIYTFKCRRMESFRHKRVLFAGDAAHQVSPFGARGANSGIQDVDNLGWKLALVLNGHAPESLLDSYDEERTFGADENILNSTRSTDFITPKSKVSHAFRNAVLELSRDYPFARPLVNSGRLSLPCTYDGSTLNGDDALPGGPERTRPGAPCLDAALAEGYLLERLGGDFMLLTIDADAPDGLEVDGLQIARLEMSADGNAFLKERYLGDAASAIYLIRPDQHVAARWTEFDKDAVYQAVRRAIGAAA